MAHEAGDELTKVSDIDGPAQRNQKFGYCLRNTVQAKQAILITALTNIEEEWEVGDNIKMEMNARKGNKANKEGKGKETAASDKSDGKCNTFSIIILYG